MPRAGIELIPKIWIFIVIFSLVLITRPCARPSLYSVKRLTPLKRIEGGVIIIAPGRLSPPLIITVANPILKAGSFFYAWNNPIWRRYGVKPDF